jgi:hypothetical protein
VAVVGLSFPQARLFSWGSIHARAASQSPRARKRLHRVSLFHPLDVRDCLATETEESSATATPLADLYSFHTAAVVHSAPPVLYLQLLGDEKHRRGRV